MSEYAPWKTSEPRPFMTVFGPVMVPGPFADDYTKLKWDFHEHRDGEWARFRVAGLEVYVQDCDGDFSFWELRDLRTKPKAVLAGGTDYENMPLPHYWKCLV